MGDDCRDRSEPDRPHEPAPLPTSLVPRWLAWVVLLALLAAAGLSTWMILARPEG